MTAQRIIGARCSRSPIWPVANGQTKARAAALALAATDEDADTIGVQLLAHIKIVFDSTKAEAVWTEDLLRHLHAMSERHGASTGASASRSHRASWPRCSSRSESSPGRSGTQAPRKTSVATRANSSFRLGGGIYSANVLEATESASFSDFPSASDESPLADGNPPKAAETARALAH